MTDSDKHLLHALALSVDQAETAEMEQYYMKIMKQILEMYIPDETKEK